MAEQADSWRTGLVMSEPFRPYEKLVEITEMSQELKWCLRAKLPADAPVSS